MKKLLGGLGKVMFWLSWPAQYIYFKIFPERSRVLVVVHDEFLVVIPWLNYGKYILPGGGKKRYESLLQSAVRELGEETGINVPESSLQPLGRKRHSQYGLAYYASHFVLQLPGKPALRPSKIEIMQTRWLKIAGSGDMLLADDVLYSLKRYKPLKQAELL